MYTRFNDMIIYEMVMMVAGMALFKGGQIFQLTFPFLIHHPHILSSSFLFSRIFSTRLRRNAGEFHR